MHLIFGSKEFKFVREIKSTQGQSGGGPASSLSRVLRIHGNVLCCHICMNVFILPEELQGMQLGEEASKPLFIKVGGQEGLPNSRKKELGRASASEGKMVWWEVPREWI